MKPKKQKQQESEPVKKSTPSEDKRLNKLAKEVEEFNPEFIKHLKQKGLLKGQ